MKNTIYVAPLLVLLAACSNDDNATRVVGQLTSDRVELTAEFSEAITAIAVTEGESVVKGQLLLQQNAERAITRVAEAQAALKQAEARMGELKRGPRSELITAARANVEGASQELDFRQSELDRIREVHQRGLASPDQLDRANAAHDAAQAALKLRLAQLEELLAGTTIEELAQAEQQVKQASARLDAASIERGRHLIIAPVDGIVDSRLFEIGERPGIGQPVIVMLGALQPHARVYVPEAIRVRIGPGTKARIYVDGLPDPIAGSVRWVASESAYTPYFALTERDRGRLSYVAKVDLSETEQRLPDGVPVEVEFILD